MDTVTHIVGEGGCVIRGLDSIAIVSKDVYNDFMISPDGIMMASRRELIILTKEKTIYLDLNSRTPQVEINNSGIGNYWNGLYVKNLSEADSIYQEYEYYCFEFYQFEGEEIVSTSLHKMDSSTYIIDTIEFRPKEGSTEFLYIAYPWLNAKVEPSPIDKPLEFIKSLPPVFH